jgi:hypothetical protein
LSDSSSHNYPTTDDATLDLAGDNAMDSDSSSLLPPIVPSGDAVPTEIGEYAIRGLIGSGGMGQVYLAEHKRMKRLVAIKMLPIERMADDRSIERFYEEVRAASRLLHPNIVTAFDAGEVCGVHYLAMEYVDGDTLTSIVARKGPFSVGEAASVIRQAALGLLHAHRSGIVHRDVKPSNLMRASDGTIKVLDLGLAQISTASLVTEADAANPGPEVKRRSKGLLVGTLPFMAPEQLEDPDSADARSDIYSLGATMYFLLTGRPPYTGELLDLVYGHRHGKIPDLMQVRDDVDMGFADIFHRMMAKSPDERYVSLDEVIDDLSEYASKTDAPLWISELTQPRPKFDHSTVAGGSTSGATLRVLAIDFGMFYAATAEASPTGGVRLLQAGGDNQPLFRMAVASERDKLVFGAEAMELRAEHAPSVVHCLPMYIGKPLVEREIAGRQCPPEVLMAMMLRRIKQNCWPGKALPHATAITIPASYDQLHRQSVLQAAQMAGLPSVRLVDRSIASVQSLLIERESESIDDPSSGLAESADQTILFVGVTGQSTEVAVVRRDSNRIYQLSTAGHWNTGMLPWQHKLVNLATKAFINEHQLDPRKSSKTAASLQMACERALNSMLVLESVTIKIDVDGTPKAVKIQRRHWLQSCEGLGTVLRKAIKTACQEASVDLAEIQTCVTLGPLLRINTIRNAVLRGRSEAMKFLTLERADTARGAAACLAAELPGRGDIAMPPRGVTSQTIGIVVSDAKGRRRILPIIPKGTSLPARTNRRLTVDPQRESMTLSLVESAGVQGDDWQSLGRYDFKVGDSRSRSRMIGFEINVNGMLSVRAQSPGTPASTKLPPLPAPALSEAEIEDWTHWLDGLR